ncbi:hypothetical protein BV25DRAFT_1819171 [Artomyces pyxidatus]|uniref:Uncharacterized protein n=1 Tax=Artomyces pyxidatus TaxID=48021 RepID=A0ACB8TH43_9AGAM|nr:hypothetical protein BV25DRAFT_1819171 [Artomyces pyxidatus]
MPYNPKGWPNDIQYLDWPRVHSSVLPSALSFIHGDAQLRDAQLRTSGRPSLLSSPSHPAYGQHGLFASMKIPSRTHILDYIGEVHCDDRPNSDYDISLHRFQDGTSVGVDASRMGNEARFVNDYRGIRLKPNAEFLDRRTYRGELRMSVWSLAEPIKKGDEIVVSYGKAWWQARTSSIPVIHVPEDNGLA